MLRYFELNSNFAKYKLIIVEKIVVEMDSTHGEMNLASSPTFYKSHCFEKF